MAGGAMRRWLAAALACAALAACTPMHQLLFSLIPDGTIPTLLSHLERESDTNRQRVAELEKAADWEGLAKFADESPSPILRIGSDGVVIYANQPAESLLRSWELSSST